jgi:hypothetical protein
LGKVDKSTAKASPNKVGEFLNPLGNLVQVICVFLPVWWSSHSKANRGWLTRARQKQKKVSFGYRQVNQLVVAVEGSGECRD